MGGVRAGKASISVMMQAMQTGVAIARMDAHIKAMQSKVDRCKRESPPQRHSTPALG